MTSTSSFSEEKVEILEHIKITETELKLNTLETSLNNHNRVLCMCVYFKGHTLQSYYRRIFALWSQILEE